MYCTHCTNHSTVFQVEFPEARIYEETLNCLLYENRTGPDQDLMQATSHRQDIIFLEIYISLNVFSLHRPPGDGYTSNDEEERNRASTGEAGQGGEKGSQLVGSGKIFIRFNKTPPPDIH